MIFAYNRAHVGDTLMVIVADDKGTENTAIRKWNVAQIKDESGQIVAWNFFHISDHLTIEGNGQVTISEEQLAELNRLIKEAGFEETLEKDNQPKIVVGYVKTCEPHPDSDHLSVTETEVDGDGGSFTNRLWCTKYRSRSKSSRGQTWCNDARRYDDLAWRIKRGQK